MAKSPKKSPSPKRSPSPCKKRKGCKKFKKSDKPRKPTHWMTLVKAVYDQKGTCGAGGLTQAMKISKPLLPAFKKEFSCIPTLGDAKAWVAKQK